MTFYGLKIRQLEVYFYKKTPRYFLFAFYIFLMSIAGHPLFSQSKVSEVAAFENSFFKEKMEKQKEEVLKNFALYGQPISPKVIQEFKNWISDIAPSIISIDLNATINTNQYSGDVKREERFGKTYFETTEGSEHFIYRVLGKLGKDKIVLASRNYSDDGTGVWTTILILKISLKEMLALRHPSDPSLSKRYMVLAEQIGSLNMPDRANYNLDGLTLDYADRGIGLGNGGQNRTIDLSPFLKE